MCLGYSKVLTFKLFNFPNYHNIPGADTKVGVLGGSKKKIVAWGKFCIIPGTGTI